MTMTPRDRALLGILAVLLLSAGFYKFVLTPEHQRAAHLQTQVVTAHSALAKAESLVATGRLAERALRQQQPDWVATRRAVPKQSNIPALLKLLARAAAQAHVSMQSISLSGPGASAATTTAAVNSALGLTSVPVSLTFNGGYQALNRLVDRLDALVTISRRSIRSRGPLVGISSVNVTPVATAAHAAQLSIQLTATIYQREPASTSSSTTSTEGS